MPNKQFPTIVFQVNVDDWSDKVSNLTEKEWYNLRKALFDLIGKYLDRLHPDLDLLLSSYFKGDTDD